MIPSKFQTGVRDVQLKAAGSDMCQEALLMIGREKIEPELEYGDGSKHVQTQNCFFSYVGE